jgi:ATP-dependent Clp protease ATP-binding subunit ClpA
MPFKRFHNDARRTVLLARDNARRLGSDQVRTEHMLLALLEVDANPARDVLERHGLTYGRAYEMVRRMDAPPALDAEALEAIGIDLEAVRGKLESVFGKGVLDTPQPTGKRRSDRQMLGQDARKTLELSLRESIAIQSGHIGAGHILLGIIRSDAGAVRILKEAGIDPKALREEVTAAL